MDRVIEYTIVEAPSAALLVKLVNEAIAQQYQPYGEVSCLMYKKDGDAFRHELWSQVMVKYATCEAAHDVD